MNDLIGGEVKADIQIEQKRSNSQTMTLLEPAVNINPNPTNTSHDLPIVDDSALETLSGPSGTLREVEAKSLNSDKVSIYIVREGDTISSIAQMFDVSANTILWSNDMKSAKELRKGQELIILPISGIKYIVKKGDTLKSIALKYGGNVEEIITFNNMPENPSLVVGDEIIIPDGEMRADTSVSVGVTKPTVSTNKANGYFIKPTKGLKTQGLHGKFKSAIDIAASNGTAVYASAAGKVIIAKLGGWNGGYGNYVVIEHSNGMQTLYAHLSSINISRGDSVKQGALIGGMGSTGNSTGSHLHFEILGTRGWNPFN